MNQESNEPEHITDYKSLLDDFHLLSSEIESLYHSYSKRMKNASEEISKQKTKQGIYKTEITGNHETIEVLLAQIDYLLMERNQNMQRIGEINRFLHNKIDVEAIKGPGEETRAEPAVNPVEEETLPPFKENIPEIRIIYESNLTENKNRADQLTKKMLDLFIDSTATKMAGRPKGEGDLRFFILMIEKDLELLDSLKKQCEKKERWYKKVWRFLWGKPEEVYHPEVMKKLNKIEEQLVEYSTKFSEVNKVMAYQAVSSDSENHYYEKMNKMHEDLKKLEEFYEEELDALRSRLDEYKRRESELEAKLSLIDETYTDTKENASRREEELEKELKRLRYELQAQTNKKNDLYSKMKQSPASTKPLIPESNPEFDKYGKGNIPIPTESSRKTMFNPTKYIR
jgi:hypothetical protein